MSALKPRLPGICAELPGGWLSPSWVDPADVRGDEPGQTGERAAGTSAVWNPKPVRAPLHQRARPWATWGLRSSSNSEAGCGPQEGSG